MVYKGNGENKEYCDRVIKEILSNWDEVVCKKVDRSDDEHISPYIKK